VPLVVVLLLAASIFVARSRRRAVIAIGAALAALTAVTVLLVSLAGNIAAEALAKTPEGEEGIKAAYNVIVDSFKQQQMFIVLGGVVMAGGGWAAGESRLTRALRSRFGQGDGEALNFRGWVADHVLVLRAAGLVVGALLFIIWPDPEPRFALTLFGLVVLYLLILWLIVSDAAWAVSARERAAEFSDRYLRAQSSSEGGRNWVARRAPVIRLALIIIGIVFLLLWPDVRFRTVAVVVVVEVLLFAGIDALAGRGNARDGGNER
jgi:hypothetical protein